MKHKMLTVVVAMGVVAGGLVNGVMAEQGQGKKAAQEKTQKAKATREQKKEQIKEKTQERVQAREKVVDNRQTRQEKRIQHGINKGYLTADEVKTLETQQASIVTLESSLKSDGKLTGSEFKQLQSALNEASRSIWSEKHDTDGTRMPGYAFGKNVVMKSGVMNENMSSAEAKAVLKEHRRMMELKKKLAAGDMSEAERVKLQAEYDGLLNKYFETK